MQSLDQHESGVNQGARFSIVLGLDWALDWLHRSYQFTQVATGLQPLLKIPPFTVGLSIAVVMVCWLGLMMAIDLAQPTLVPGTTTQYPILYLLFAFLRLSRTRKITPAVKTPALSISTS